MIRSLVLGIALTSPLFGKASVATLGYPVGSLDPSEAFQEVGLRTSVEVDPKIDFFQAHSKEALSQFWLWSKDISLTRGNKGSLTLSMSEWLKKGGFLVIQNYKSVDELKSLTKDSFFNHPKDPPWDPIPPGHELMRSFYLIESLPSCNNLLWQGFEFDQRLAILAIPFDFLEALSDKGSDHCLKNYSKEQLVRVMINTFMVALTTDYKKDQIHNANMKRLR